MKEALTAQRRARSSTNEENEAPFFQHAEVPLCTSQPSGHPSKLHLTKKRSWLIFSNVSFPPYCFLIFFSEYFSHFSFFYIFHFFTFFRFFFSHFWHILSHHCIFGGFFSSFHRFWSGFGTLLGPMLASKRHWKLTCNFGWILLRIFINFYWFLRPRNLNFDKQSTRNPCFWKFTVSQIFSICIYFGGHVGLQNPPKIHWKSIENLSKK
mgnify:CR=1 FL=1